MRYLQVFLLACVLCLNSFLRNTEKQFFPKNYLISSIFIIFACKLKTDKTND